MTLDLPGKCIPIRECAWGPFPDWKGKPCSSCQGGYNIQKLQATSYKLQATSYKLQATSYKLQATSYKLQATRNLAKFARAHREAGQELRIKS